MIHATYLWLNDPDNWRTTNGTAGIIAQVGAHLKFSLLALVIASIIALPAGLLIGHTGRGSWIVAIANGLRALPTVGLLILFYVLLAPHIHGSGNTVYLIPTELVLILLAVPPVMANTYAGVQNVNPATRDAAIGMGMTGREVLFKVELPNALPLIFSGIRSAVLQLIATGTVAAYVGLGGLGRFVYDGLASRDFPEMTGGAVIVAALALVMDGLLALIQRYTVSRGVSGRFKTSSKQGRATDGAEGEVAEAELAAAGSSRSAA